MTETLKVVPAVHEFITLKFYRLISFWGRVSPSSYRSLRSYPNKERHLRRATHQVIRLQQPESSISIPAETAECFYDQGKVSNNIVLPSSRSRIDDMAPNLDRRKSRVPGLTLLWLLGLFLWALPAAQAEKTAADYYVKSLPGAPKGPLLKMHAG